QSGQWLRPGQLLADAGYGLPQADEQAEVARAAAAASVQAVPAWQALRVQLRAQLPSSQQRELDDIDRNLAVLGARVREQAAAVPPTGAAAR
ncbi:MAG: hypothetical protein ACN6OL_09070, partial [Stenotrophomonas indicatrix]